MKIHRNLEQGSDEWFALRAGKVTASEVDKIITAQKLNPSAQLDKHARKLAAEVVMGEPCETEFAGNRWTERGKQLEPEAIDWYVSQSGDFIDRTIGFIEFNDDIGFSPDGVVFDGDEIVYIAEVKCLTTPNHVEALDRIEAVAVNYALQVYTQLLCGAQYCDLVFYHPKLPKIIRRILPDQEKMAKILKSAKLCIEARDRYVEKIKSLQQLPEPGDII